MSADIKSENLFLAVLRVVGQDALRIVFPPPDFVPKKLLKIEDLAAAGAGAAAAAGVGMAPLPVKL